MKERPWHLSPRGQQVHATVGTSAGFVIIGADDILAPLKIASVLKELQPK
jgi:hypothetical protein